MKRKKIALFLLGGSISTFKDPETGGRFRIENKKELQYFIPDLEKNVDIEIFNNITSEKFFFTPKHWEKAHNFLVQKISRFDGVVVLQETDTLLVGASMFGLLNKELKIPVIFTSSPTPFGSGLGEQVPKENLINAIKFAKSDLGETAIYSHGKLIRAVRAKRRNIIEVSPFFSAQIDDLGGVDDNGDIFLNIHRKRRDNTLKNFPLRPSSKNIILIRLFPGYTIDCLEYLRTHKQIDSIVIESLGYGSIKEDICSKLDEFYHANIPVIVVAEHDNKNRKILLNADTNISKRSSILLVRNMTVWSTFSKAHIAAENTSSVHEFYEFMKKNISGEITE